MVMFSSKEAQSKNQILEADLSALSSELLTLKVPLALPASAKLVFGMCAIWKRKSEYLLTDSVEVRSLGQ